MKHTIFSIATAAMLNVFSVSAYSQEKAVLKQYDMGDGSTIHAMSDNGKWAVAYGVSFT